MFGDARRAAAPSSGAVQRATENDTAMLQGGEMGPGFERALNENRGGGHPLPATTRNVMNGQFGANFDNVRVHTGPQADQLSRSISADAFTTGRDIFFRQGVYNPASPQGQSVLAHELTHVAQQGAAGKPQVQRLLAANAFKKNTSLTGRKGSSGSFFAGVVAALRAYEGPLAGAAATVKIKHLTTLSQTLAAWLQNRGSKSSRRKYVFTLKTEVENEVFQVSKRLSKLQGNEFTDANVAKAEDAKYGAQMNSLDELVYRFAVEEDDTGALIKDNGGEFVALFKENLAVDPLGSQKANAGGMGHRGAGIPKNNPQFANRNLAMAALDKLLGGNVVPKTFLAHHNGKQGFVMEKVEGSTGAQLEKAARNKEADDPERLFLKAAMTNPMVRKNLSTIYLLDQICAQVDRHSGNYMIVVENGVIKGAKAIDNDLAFGKDVPIQQMLDDFKGDKAKWRRMATIGLLMDELNEIDRAFAQRIVQVADQPQLVRDALKGLLDAEEITATLERLDKLADFLRPMIADPSNPILKSKWE